MNNWMKKSLLVLSLGSLMAMPLAAESLDLSEGTMAAGGALGLQINNPLTGGDLAPSNWGYTAGGSLALDYFLIDNLSLGLNLGGTYSFGGSTGMDNGFFFGLGVSYYFDMGSNIAPYLSVGANITKYGPWGLEVPAGLGLLVAMNSSVGLVFGVNARFKIPFGGTDSTKFSMGVGYAGVKAFF